MLVWLRDIGRHERDPVAGGGNLGIARFLPVGGVLGGKGRLLGRIGQVALQGRQVWDERCLYCRASQLPFAREPAPTPTRFYRAASLSS